VRLNFVGCDPTRHTPIIIEQIRRRRDGAPSHRFAWSCPRCGRRLPRFKAVTLGGVATVSPTLRGASVFFLDRVSPAAVALAARASAEGAVVADRNRLTRKRLIGSAYVTATNAPLAMSPMICSPRWASASRSQNTLMI